MGAGCRRFYKGLDLGGVDLIGGVARPRRRWGLQFAASLLDFGSKSKSSTSW
jgi:hypothetical protein